jgi:hypothetical protein
MCATQAVAFGRDARIECNIRRRGVIVCGFNSWAASISGPVILPGMERSMPLPPGWRSLQVGGMAGAVTA